MFAEWLEKAINAYLALDPATKNRWQPLVGNVIQLVIRPLDLSIYLQLSADGVHVLETSPKHVDTVIKGTPIAFLQSGLGKMPKELTIEGNVELGKTFSEILRQMDIDWEEHLSHYIGDVPAHQLGKFVQHTRQFADKAATSLQQNVTEYLQEEAQLLPSKLMLDDFYQDVDQLRDDVERLAARIELLSSKKKKGK